MQKTLSEMSLDEFWQLFPIILTKHNRAWQDWYHEEQNYLTRILPNDGVVRISHIGSTAVDTIWAKPKFCRMAVIEYQIRRPTDV